RVDHVINKQYLAVERPASDGDELCDVQLALHGAGGFTVAAGREDTEGNIVDPGHHVTDPDPATRKAQDFVELPLGLMHDQRQPLDHTMIFLPGYPEVPIR